MAKLTSRILAAEDREAWQSLWLRSQRAFQHHWNWCECAAAGVGKPVRVGLFDKGESLVAGCAFVERPKRLQTAWTHPAPAPWCGLLHAERHLAESFLRDCFEAVDASIPSQIDRSEIIFDSVILDLRSLIWNGWSARPHYNYVQPILAPDQMRAHVSRTLRWHLKKAEAGETGFRRGIDQLEPLLELWEKTRSHKRVEQYVAPEAYRKLAAWMVGSAGDGVRLEIMTAAGKSGAIEAGALCVVDVSRVSYIFGASDPEAKGSDMPTLLLMELLRVAHEENWAPLFDWVGANTPSVAQFKKEFRPELELLLFAERHSRKGALLHAVRRIAGH